MLITENSGEAQRFLEMLLKQEYVLKVDSKSSKGLFV